MADSSITSSLDRLERAIDGLETAVDQCDAQTVPIDDALRIEVRAAIAALDTMIGPRSG